ncbi:MAG: hypothetical protein Q4E35_09950 [Eubacteriales bacterium]|nr:hypothetical protein [Eubacteriales bacterium]
MLTYANSFSCSANKSKTEYVLTFRQCSPIIDEKGASKGTNIETVSQIVLNAEGAVGLCALLNTILSSGQQKE